MASDLANEKHFSVTSQPRASKRSPAAPESVYGVKVGPSVASSY